MRDADIRGALLDRLSQRYIGDLVRSEVGLCLGATRVDVVVVNGHLHGFEIKSERDTLTRLQGQIELYSRVLDYATVVTGARHTERVLDLVPGWWGVLEVSNPAPGIQFIERSAPKLNLVPDPLAIAQLLWRDEVAALLAARGEPVRRRETRWHLWDRLAALPLRELQVLVRDQLKARPHWPGG